MKNIGLIIAGLFFLNLCYPQKPEAVFRVMFYNVENLFDISDHPDKTDEEFTPGSEKAWDEKKYGKKLEDIAAVIQAVDKKDLPEIIGLCEVENQKVLRDLVEINLLRRGEYDIVHYESADLRGIDCALLYRKEKFKVISSRPIPVTFPFDSTETTRDILYVEGRTSDREKLHLFVNHWSSRRDGERQTEPKRIFCAVTLRKEVDAVLNREPGAKIIIMGDFNDEPTNRSVFEILLANNKRKNAGERELYNLMYDLHNTGNEGTYNYQGKWNMMDQIIISRSVLRDQQGWHTGYDEARILKEKFMLYHNEESQQYVPNKTYGGPTYYGGISDHFPVYVTLVRTGD